MAAGDHLATPTAAFQRVIQRAAIHVQASGRNAVTGADVLLACFSERENPAIALLAERGVSRLDVVNFLVHGIRRDGPRGRVTGG